MNAEQTINYIQARCAMHDGPGCLKTLDKLIEACTTEGGVWLVCGDTHGDRRRAEVEMIDRLEREMSGGYVIFPNAHFANIPATGARIYVIALTDGYDRLQGLPIKGWCRWP